ncbi:PQQ-like beta-propeller repeat protein [Sphingomonas astaxanthinifaciens]|uniref:Pyrrolo-quinoline quinone n=1 Tax=Sphingomonas astaxanthinifaciens DSM 22298 TaxID=1123267 RepID=A0ABQ5Z8S8_9SPHN|nr:PQQ-like beta-propeller repeat protein [Sphingomonas astaxanthinifaciens]GLR47268.1 pyrrolo-quinoline quinone [Sphingomonas astaxanthinifaciens DSM 22298]
MKRNVVTILLAASLLAGCGVVGKSRPKTPVVGDRISVLETDPDVQVDPATAALPFTLPAAVANDSWTQPGGSASKSSGHPALGTTLGQAFDVSIGQGTSLDERLAGGPVIANGTVYTIDTTATVRAFDAATGGLRWASQFGTEKGNSKSLFGGGVSVEGNRVYATNGLGFVAALDTSNGGKVWQVRPGGPLRGAPTVVGDTLYVMSQDNQLYSLKTADGTQNWSATAAVEIAGVFGTGAPAFAQGTVVAGFSSGELNAYRYENGRAVWQDALSRTSISTSVANLSDIDASPVIDGGQVFALGQGGRMVALDLITGQRIWELNLAGIATPWVAGDWVFAVTDDAKVMAIARNTGKIRWINQLAAFEKPKSRRGPISYVGPVLAGGRLIVAGDNGVLINIDPATGAFQSQTNVGAPVSLTPVVANSTLYVLDDKGRLHAYR